LHTTKGIYQLQNKILHNINSFKEFSRLKALQAQNREYQTIQPKEQLSTLSKAKITLTNYLGGQYFLTVDEVNFNNNYVQLIESKHSKTKLLPSENDIKDALLKLILYSNLNKVYIHHQSFTAQAILKLTSNKIRGKITSNDNQHKIAQFLTNNKLNSKECKLITTLINGAYTNNFILQIENI